MTRPPPGPGGLLRGLRRGLAATMVVVVAEGCGILDGNEILGVAPAGGSAGMSGMSGMSGAGGVAGGAGASGAGSSGASGACGAPTCAGADEFGTSWRPVRLGGGGRLSGMDIAPDGTKVVRAGSYGAYLWSGTAWRQLISASSIAAPDVDRFGGVEEIRVAPGHSQRFYMSYLGARLRSDNQGASWSTMPFPVDETALDLSAVRVLGQKMAVDPANPDVVYVGTVNQGLWVTSDGGQSWSKVTGVPDATPSTGGVQGIAFDPSSGTSNGRTNTLHAASWGQGVYVSHDAGASWSHPAGGPADVSHGKVSSQGGTYYATGDGNSKVWRLHTGAWKDITPSAGTWATVALDPAKPGRVVAGDPGGALAESTDGGDTWTALGPPTHVSPDIPWIAGADQSLMVIADMEFDPTTPGLAWVAAGDGAWSTAPSSALTYASRSVGLELAMTNALAAPPGGKPVAASLLYGLFRLDDPDVFPATHAPGGSPPVQDAWSLDWAPGKPSFLVALVSGAAQRAGSSSDGGLTWTPFASYPPQFSEGTYGGSIAASSPTNLVWIPSDNAPPYFTQDGGVTWQKCEFPGLTAASPGWHSNRFFRRHVVVADRVQSGTFYAYHSTAGVYRSTDGALSWQLVKTGELSYDSIFNARLRAVPGHAGHLFFTGGQSATATNPDTGVPLLRSTDAGVTWTASSDAAEIYDVGFGKPVGAGDYPAVYIAGWVKGVYGIHRSDDQGSTWTQIGRWPLGRLDRVETVTGDLDQAGRIYLGFSGSGFLLGGTAP